MQHDAFIGQVQARAKLSSRGEAEGITRATLETLGERVTEQLADHLAAQLPREIGENLRRTEVFGGAGSGERFDRSEFIRRVSSRSGMDEPKATYGARVVFEVLREATEGGVVSKVRDALPEELQALVDAGSTGELR